MLHETYTDIITFDLTSPGEPLTGEIYISIERVRENAVIFKEKFATELLRVVFHGALHLCGYADKTAPQQAMMRKKESECLTSFNSYIADI